MKKKRIAFSIVSIITVSIFGIAGIVASYMGQLLLGMLLAGGIPLTYIIFLSILKTTGRFVKVVYGGNTFDWMKLRRIVSLILVILIIINSCLSFIAYFFFASTNRLSKYILRKIIGDEVVDSIEEVLDYDWGETEFIDSLVDPDPNVLDTTLPDGQSLSYSSLGELLVEIARSEYNYWEENATHNGKVHTPKQSTGYSNVGQKYWSMFGYNANWCAMFVSWCVNEFGKSGGDEAVSVFQNKNTTYRNAGCDEWYEYFNKDPRFKIHTNASDGYTPKAGDIALFTPQGVDSTSMRGHPDFTHISIVEKVESGYVWTFGGNEGGTSSGGNVYYKVSTVRNNKHSISGSKYLESPSGSRNMVIIEVPYPVISRPSSNSAALDYTTMETDKNGYYTYESYRRYVYERLKTLGYSNYVIAGILGNIRKESGGGYDQVEGYATSNMYIGSSASSMKLIPKDSGSFRTGDPGGSLYGNGNYKKVTAAGITVNGKKYATYADFFKGCGSYDLRRENGSLYGFGYGLVQWSQDRRTKYVQFAEGTLSVSSNNKYNYSEFVSNAKANNWQTLGPTSIFCQAEYEIYELLNTHTKAHEKMKELSLKYPDGTDYSAREHWFTVTLSDVTKTNSSGSNYTAVSPSMGQGNRLSNSALAFHDLYEKSGDKTDSLNLRIKYAMEEYAAIKDWTPTPTAIQQQSGISGGDPLSAYTIIGDSNTQGMFNLLNASNIDSFAITGVGLGTYNSLKSKAETDKNGGTGTSSSVAEGLTLAEAITNYNNQSGNSKRNYIIILGTNDGYTANFKTNYGNLITFLKGLSNTNKIYICTVPPRYETEVKSGSNGGRYIKLDASSNPIEFTDVSSKNTAIKEIAASNPNIAGCIDLYTAIKNNISKSSVGKVFSTDGIHLTSSARTDALLFLQSQKY